jgi:hypothetical protein
MPRHYHRPASSRQVRAPREIVVGGTYSPERAHSFEIQKLKAEFDAMPREKRLETIERVIALLQREADRPEGEHSHLWNISPDVYGIDPKIVCVIHAKPAKPVKRAA